jgi:lauroyl/myristoyl acyltransferase
MSTSPKQALRSTAELVVEWLRRHLPVSLLPALVTVRFRVAWAIPAVREDARRQMRFLLEQSRPDADVEAAARGYVRWMIWRAEARWHPETVTQQRVEGLENLVGARDLGRGVVLNFMHHGAYDGAFASLARLGAPSHMLVYPYMVRPDAPRWLKQHMHVASSAGGFVTSADIGTQGITDLLRGGAVVSIASDVPGRTPVKFVGRELLGSFGAARAAATTGSPVVVLTCEVDEDGPFVRVHEPLHPEDHDTPQALLEQMLARLEQVILRWPEATDLPLSRWGTPASGDAR